MFNPQYNGLTIRGHGPASGGARVNSGDIIYLMKVMEFQCMNETEYILPTEHRLIRRRNRAYAVTIRQS
jgi:hypothetical protein